MSIRPDTKAYIEKRASESGIVCGPVEDTQVIFVDAQASASDMFAQMSSSESPLWMLSVIYGGYADEDFLIMAEEPVARSITDWIGEMCRTEHETDPDHPAWSVELFRADNHIVYRVCQGPGTPDEPAKCVCGDFGYVLDEQDKIQRCHNCNP